MHLGSVEQVGMMFPWWVAQGRCNFLQETLSRLLPPLPTTHTHAHAHSPDTPHAVLHVHMTCRTWYAHVITCRHD